MTMPNEHTKAFIETRWFPRTPSDSEDEVMWNLVRSAAIQLIRHYPLDADIDISSSTVPSVWATPGKVEGDRRDR
ncbi:BPSL0761 family protein [Paraburkholderia hospita]|jgi:hypothetical protein|uniref:BPSL0761 family protein n=1 Tax=Paraburkholderia hospita TaxID=169430 RepID=UPI000271BEB7|nr:BPSL0761 family protein [Paraburkholderia hospita]EUC16534.1 hypothetical protein PMI06_004868 [Burkholderia sp. BT03]SKC77781.1 hypothetical protein SAMN06266956_3145 [Paraburkholderia hospita]